MATATTKPTVVRLNNARIAFPKLWTPEAVNGEGKPAFSAQLILDPKANAADIAAVKTAMREAAKAKWGEKAAAVYKTLEASADKLALRNGDTKADYTGFEGNFFVSARNYARPTVIDQFRNPLTEADGKPYSGCYVNASVEIWAQDNKFGKRINATLRGVQFARDGEAFSGGGAASADEFDEVPVTEGADEEFV